MQVMDRPRLLLVPEFTELEWTAIRPQMESWAEVASFDLPGVGDEPRPEILDRSVIVNRGLEELDRRGWDRFFVAVDGWGAPSAIELALERPEAGLWTANRRGQVPPRRDGE